MIIYDENIIEELSAHFFSLLTKYESKKKLLLNNVDIKLLKRIIFKDEKVCYKIRDKYKSLYKKIDFSNIDFDNVDVREFDFTGTKGVKINPQKVYYKNLVRTKLYGVEITGSLDGCVVIGTDFTESIGAKLNPQTVYKKNLCDTKLSDVEIIGDFEDVYICGTDFTGSKGANINLQKIRNKTLFFTKLCDSVLIGNLDNVCTSYTDFDGCIFYDQFINKIKDDMKTYILKNNRK